MHRSIGDGLHHLLAVSPGKRAIRKAGQQCVENSLKADHNLFAGYYRKLMI